MEAANKGLRESRRALNRDAKSKINVKNKDPNFEYRVVNDVEEGQRIKQFQELGWVIDIDTKVGDKKVDKVSSEGSPKQISVGQGVKAFVMKIPKEIYKIDQDLKEDDLRQSEAGLKPEGTYGTIKMDSETRRK